MAGLCAEADYIFIPEDPPKKDWGDRLCKQLSQARLPYHNGILNFFYYFILWYVETIRWNAYFYQCCLVNILSRLSILIYIYITDWLLGVYGNIGLPAHSNWYEYIFSSNAHTFFFFCELIVFLRTNNEQMSATFCCVSKTRGLLLFTFQFDHKTSLSSSMY